MSVEIVIALCACICYFAKLAHVLFIVKCLYIYILLDKVFLLKLYMSNCFIQNMNEIKFI